MTRWRYFDDPDLRDGDVIMTTHAYRPSWLYRRRVDCSMRLRRWPRLAALLRPTPIDPWPLRK